MITISLPAERLHIPSVESMCVGVLEERFLGLPKEGFFELKQDFLLGRHNKQHGMSLMSRKAPHREAMLNFLVRYFTENCDYMPQSNMWHLTSSNHKTDMFQEFPELMETTN